MSASASSPQGLRSHRPGRGWRWARRSTQLLIFQAIVVAPFLGGWQRLDRVEIATFNREGAELPVAVQDRLPMGEAPSRAYAWLELVGGGLSTDLVGIPAADPIAGTLALIRSEQTSRAWIAVAIPILLALVGGRIYCGWFCPFGMIARSLAWLHDRLPIPRRPRVPKRRAVRWIVLLSIVIASVFGAHLLLYLALPHLLVQQSVYALWLLGGGSALLGVFAGLLVAALIFGPTTYCTAICPTGAALSLAGRARRVHLKIAEPSRCGARCAQCSVACWLQLEPASGDPGSDCDLCARCITSCPKTNLRVGFGVGERKLAEAAAGVPRHTPSTVTKTATLFLLLSACTTISAFTERARAEGEMGASTLEDEDLGSEQRGRVDYLSEAETKPTMVLRAERHIGDVDIGIELVDMTGVRLASESTYAEHGMDVSFTMARGERGEPDERGILPERPTYDGKLQIVLIRESGARLRILFDRPNSPESTGRRTIYRRRVDFVLEPGDRVEIPSIDGWLDDDLDLLVPDPGTVPSLSDALLYALAALLVFGGLLSLALVPPKSATAGPK